MGIETEFGQRYAQAAGGCPLPPEAAAAYEVLECLHEGAHKAVWLARDRAGGDTCVLKVACGGHVRFLQAEWDCLRALEGERYVPRPLRYGADGECAWLARTWHEGRTLDELVREDGFFSAARVVRYGMALCDVLHALHVRGYVCRDVKPENLLVTPDDRLLLIDCDTVRRYDAAKQRDTVIVASHDTAAPEQYGFSQSDARTDVYGIGRTLIFLASACYRPEQLRLVRMPGRLRRVLMRAASAQPSRRYPDAAAMKKALSRCRRPLWPFPAAAALAGAVALLIWRPLLPAPAAVVSDAPSPSAPGLAGTETFCAKNHQALLDDALACYARRDPEGLAAACEALVSALYADPALLQGEPVDYALLSPLPDDFFRVTPAVGISYSLWYSDETLRRHLGAYTDYAADLLRVLDDHLTAAALGERVSSIHNYLHMEPERRGEVLAYALYDMVLLLGMAIDVPPA